MEIHYINLLPIAESVFWPLAADSGIFERTKKSNRYSKTLYRYSVHFSYFSLSYAKQAARRERMNSAALGPFSKGWQRDRKNVSIENGPKWFNFLENKRNCHHFKNNEKTLTKILLGVTSLLKGFFNTFSFEIWHEK